MKAGRLLLGIVFIGAGAAHFLATPRFVAIVPDYIPDPQLAVQLSGLAEMAGGIGVLLPPTRRAAAWGLFLLLVAVFPANLWMAQHAVRYRPLPAWALWARLPLQLPLLAWAWLYTRPRETGSR